MYSEALKALIRGDQETMIMLNTYIGFFKPVQTALHNAMILDAAKALDKDPRTASLPNLLKAAKESPEYAPRVDLAPIDEWIVEQRNFVDNLTRLRHKRLAHLDAVDDDDLKGLLFGEFEDLLRVLQEHSNSLERAFYGYAATVDQQRPQARKDTEEVRRLLIATLGESG